MVSQDLDVAGEEAFRRNPQCALINANNPFMVRRVECRNRRARMTFSGLARGQFSC